MSKVRQIIHTLATADETFKLVQISDPHLFADANACLLGVNTRDSFLATLQSVKINHKDLDAIVVTGDISQDLSAESYRFFASQMESFDCPVLCLAGNHDEMGYLLEHLNSEQLHTSQAFQTRHWQILLAHSQVEGEVYGMINEQEMEWLKQKLDQNQKPTIVFTHHHPVYTDTDWIDVIGIKNCEEFTQMLASYSHVKACGFGHIHQAIAIEQEGVQYFSVPSTCVQFKAKSKNFAISDELPGYRLYEFSADGQIKSQVFRVENFELTLDKTATGY